MHFFIKITRCCLWFYSYAEHYQGNSSNLLKYIPNKVEKVSSSFGMQFCKITDLNRATPLLVRSHISNCHMSTGCHNPENLLSNRGALIFTRSCLSLRFSCVASRRLQTYKDIWLWPPHGYQYHTCLIHICNLNNISLFLHQANLIQERHCSKAN